jgi:hypothetical protein
MTPADDPTALPPEEDEMNRKHDAPRCCATCTWVRTKDETFYCGWRHELCKTPPDSSWCLAFGTGCHIDADNSHWESDYD